MLKNIDKENISKQVEKVDRERERETERERERLAWMSNDCNTERL